MSEVGDYVLSTKYRDGDPCDHFFIGFVSAFDGDRYMIVDNAGRNQRANGFRRAEQITEEEGRQLVAMMPIIGDTPGPSMWWHLSQIRGVGGERFCPVCRYEKDGSCRCDSAEE